MLNESRNTNEVLSIWRMHAGQHPWAPFASECAKRAARDCLAATTLSRPVADLTTGRADDIHEFVAERAGSHSSSHRTTSHSTCIRGSEPRRCRVHPRPTHQHRPHSPPRRLQLRTPRTKAVSRPSDLGSRSQTFNHCVDPLIQARAPSVSAPALLLSPTAPFLTHPWPGP